MKRLLLPALLLTTLTACTAAPADTLPAAVPTPTPASTPAPTAAPAPADALTPEEKIGQLFIIRPDALDLTLPQETINDAKADGVTMLTDAMRETLQAYPVGGICQFGKNITDPEQLAQFNADLQAASRTPLFIAVDEEGGAVARLANHPAFDLPQYESAAAVGASGDPVDACAMGQTIGAQLGFMKFVGWFVLANYLVNEIRSILENLVDMNVNVPPFLIKGLKIAADKIDAAAKMGDGKHGE